MYSRIYEPDLEPFKQWLRTEGYKLLDPKGDYEVLRWSPGKPGTPMPIIFRREHANRTYFPNKAAVPFIVAWRKEQSN